LVLYETRKRVSSIERKIFECYSPWLVKYPLGLVIYGIFLPYEEVKAIHVKYICASINVLLQLCLVNYCIEAEVCGRINLRNLNNHHSKIFNLINGYVTLRSSLLHKLFAYVCCKIWQSFWWGTAGVYEGRQDTHLLDRPISGNIFGFLSVMLLM